MEPFTVHRGIAASLNRANVDTDQIIPKQFLKSIKRTGFGPAAFFDWRYLDNGDPDPDFELNAPRFEGRSILVTRNNFGCGSSREHAVWALAQDGYRAIIAPQRGKGDERIPGFADIFRNNCTKNGILPVELSEDEVEEIFQAIEANAGLKITVDLEKQTVTVHAPEEKQYRFEIQAGIRNQLMKGLDDIDLSLEHLDAIEAFEAKHENQLGKFA